MSKVSIVKCSDYEQQNVDSAVSKCIDMIGGITSVVKPGNRVLIKVNLLMGVGPNAAVTTHPAVVSALIKEVRKAGGIPIIGDSPGNATSNYQKTLKETGMQKIADEMKVEIVNFSREIVEHKSPSKNRQIPILHLAKAVFDADVIISAPKLKTHNFMLFTGAVKNMFGAVPGFHKGNYHAKAAKPADFAKALVDILELTRPKLCVMDAIDGMEGHGPSGGTPRRIGIIMASKDAVSMDSVGSNIIGYDPLDIDTTKIAFRRKLGEAQLDKIEITGEPLDNVKLSDYKLADNANVILKRIPGFLIWIVDKLLSKKIRVEPVINPEACTYCQICMKSCPVDTIKTAMYDTEDGKKKKVCRIKHDKCIMCFCCHELCEYNAITIRRSWLAKKLSIGYENQ